LEAVDETFSSVGFTPDEYEQKWLALGQMVHL